MAEGKSKHPGLIKAAMQNLGVMKNGVGRAQGQLKAISAAATSLAKMSGDTEKVFKDQLGYCEKVIDKYATKVNEIAEIEEDLKAAKGDKKAEAEILKKHKKADGEADALREEYNEAVKVFATMTETQRDAADKVAEAADAFIGFSANGPG